MKVMRQLNRLAVGVAVIGVAAAASVSIAQADGMPSRGRAVVYEKPADWGGFYFGAHSGWQWSDIDASIAATPTQGYGVQHDSAVVGGQIGIQHQFGNFVLGVEASLTSAFRDEYASTACPNAVVSCAARFDDVLTIGPRLGWAMGKWMPYLTGGYANAAFSQKAVVAGITTDLDQERHNGWYIGGGVDMALARGWTIGIEYRHYEFDDALHFAHTPGGVGVPGSHTVVDATSDTVTARVSWKLGRPEARPLK